MSMSKHWFRVLLLAVLWFGAQVTGCVAAPKSEAADAQAYVKDAMAAMSDLAGYHADLLVDIRLPMANVNLGSRRDFLLQPAFVSRNASEIVFNGFAEEQKKARVKSYTKQTGDRLVGYTETGTQWEWRMMPYHDVDFHDAGRIFMSGVKQAKIRKLMDEIVTIEVTVDGKTVGQDLIKMLGEGFPAQVNSLNSIFHFNGDITYIVYINRQTGHLMSVYMDLSDAVRKSLALMLENPEPFAIHMNPEDKSKFKSLLGDLQIVVQMDVSKINQVEPFDVPTAVVAHAVDAQTRYAEASAIGIIGGADGPTAVYIAEKMSENL